MVVGNGQVSQIIDVAIWAKSKLNSLATPDDQKDSKIENKKTAEKKRAIELKIEQENYSAQINPPVVDVFTPTATTVNILKETQKAFSATESEHPQIDSLKESFKKSYGMGRSHGNLMVSLFHRSKAAVISGGLWALGVKSDELQALRDEALSDSTQQSTSLLTETIKTDEMTFITVGAKQAKRNSKVTASILEQLRIQLLNLGKPELVSPEHLLEMRRSACEEIQYALNEERASLVGQYQILGGSEVV